MQRSAKEYAEAYLQAVKGADRNAAAATAETLLALLRRRGELRLLPGIVAAVEAALQETTVIATVSAEPLTAAAKRELAASVGLAPDQVRFEEKTEAVGPGVRLRIGDIVLDATLAARLAALRSALLTNR